MDVREKLVGLLEEIPHPQRLYPDLYVDRIIEKGVTVQEWISFDDVKPKDRQSVLGITTEGEMEVYQFDENWQDCLCRWGGNVKTFNITHWMPLPQPPKGE